jgi:lambda repressor-like predicted transcriptional regulator
VSQDELLTALRDGGSLAAVAEEQGVELDTLVQALVEAAQERLDAAVADGRLIQEQADQGTVEPSSLGTA